jgi:hypothetical protein
MKEMISFCVLFDPLFHSLSPETKAFDWKIKFLNFDRLSHRHTLIFKIILIILYQLHGFVLNYYVYYKIILHRVILNFTKTNLFYFE